MKTNTLSLTFLSLALTAALSACGAVETQPNDISALAASETQSDVDRQKPADDSDTQPDLPPARRISDEDQEKDGDGTIDYRATSQYRADFKEPPPEFHLGGTGLIREDAADLPEQSTGGETFHQAGDAKPRRF